MVRHHRLAAEGNGKARRYPRAILETLLEKRDKGAGPQTDNFYLAAVKQFCAWLVKDRRTLENPLAHLKGKNPRTDRRHDRRPLSENELRLVLVGARASKEDFRGLDGKARHILYVTACVTGFRASELARVDWARIIRGACFFLAFRATLHCNKDRPLAVLVSGSCTPAPAGRARKDGPS